MNVLFFQGKLLDALFQKFLKILGYSYILFQ